jgi:hypothetical protein
MENKDLEVADVANSAKDIHPRFHKENHPTISMRRRWLN